MNDLTVDSLAAGLRRGARYVYAHTDYAGQQWRVELFQVVVPGQRPMYRMEKHLIDQAFVEVISDGVKQVDSKYPAVVVMYAMRFLPPDQSKVEAAR